MFQTLVHQAHQSDVGSMQRLVALGAPGSEAGSRNWGTRRTRLRAIMMLGMCCSGTTPHKRITDQTDPSTPLGSSDFRNAKIRLEPSMKVEYSVNCHSRTHHATLNYSPSTPKMSILVAPRLEAQTLWSP